MLEFDLHAIFFFHGQFVLVRFSRTDKSEIQFILLTYTIQINKKDVVYSEVI